MLHTCAPCNSALPLPLGLFFVVEMLSLASLCSITLLHTVPSPPLWSTTWKNASRLAIWNHSFQIPRVPLRVKYQFSLTQDHYTLGNLEDLFWWLFCLKLKCLLPSHVESKTAKWCNKNVWMWSETSPFQADFLLGTHGSDPHRFRVLFEKIVKCKYVKCKYLMLYTSGYMLISDLNVPAKS